MGDRERGHRDPVEPREVREPREAPDREPAGHERERADREVHDKPEKVDPAREIKDVNEPKEVPSPEPKVSPSPEPKAGQEGDKNISDPGVKGPPEIPEIPKIP